MEKRTKSVGIVTTLIGIGAIAMMAALHDGSSVGDKMEISDHGKGKPNKLINEKSPYLLQHAYNPVHWYPWGEEAFEKARLEDKPILVSIGYSTCHWCHVMESESFSDPRVAEVMNENLVCIKVDREERPAVDKIYLSAVSAMTGSAGWPLNVFLTPDLKPFYGGTYFPPEGRWGSPGWPDVVERIGRAWRNPEERKQLVSSAEGLTETLEQYLSGSTGATDLDDAWLAGGFKALESGYDAELGGFAGAPKFPMPVNHNFLLRYQARAGGGKGEGEIAAKARQMSLRTLRAMAEGGIYDHLGGGFHRYSTDERWHVPHFEKMLYDNAQLALNYLDAFQITHEEFFEQVARETLDYVLRDMTHPEGAFYSAEDADSEPADRPGKDGESAHGHKAEGAFYVWESGEILDILGPEAGEIFQYRYGVKAGGNALHDPHGEFKGKNVLFAANSPAETAARFERSEDEVRRIISEAKAKLFEARSRRPRPHLDDKVITAWNGLAISAFARAYQVLGDERYLSAAEKAAAFMRLNLYESETKRLYRRWRDGEKKVRGIADDYAFLTQGLIDLYEASFDPKWLDWAFELTEEQLSLFFDAEHGGFFMTSPGHDENIIIRVKEDTDNVEPAAGSVAAMNLLRLAGYSDRKDLRRAAEKTMRLFGKQMKEHPAAVPQMLAALDLVLSKPYQIIIVGRPDDPGTKAMLRKVHSRFIPNKILIVLDRGSGRKGLVGRLPFLKNLSQIDARPTAYVCVNYTCKLPTNDVGLLGRLLDGDALAH